jgi:hypothetical protein
MVIKLSVTDGQGVVLDNWAPFTIEDGDENLKQFLAEIDNVIFTFEQVEDK